MSPKEIEREMSKIRERTEKMLRRNSQISKTVQQVVSKLEHQLGFVCESVHVKYKMEGNMVNL